MEDSVLSTMRKSKITTPLNLGILNLPEDALRVKKPVTSLDIFAGGSKSLHPDGLFSIDIFGVIGTIARNNSWSYINIKVPIMHPMVFDALTSMKTFYKAIIEGKEFARFDDDIGDFVPAAAFDGETGYAFFASNFDKIVFNDNGSEKRKADIALIEKHKSKCLFSKIYVIPAGLRDLEVDDSGRESSDEINNLYYKLIAISNNIDVNLVKINPEAYDISRISLQSTYNQIYSLLKTVIEGKKNLIQGKFASRKVFYSTRNVITAMNTTITELGAEGNPTVHSTFMGVIQVIKSYSPIAIYHIKNDFLSKVFKSTTGDAVLCNPSTLESTHVSISNEIRDTWMTTEGINNIINSFIEPAIRQIPVKISGYYLGLCYRGKDNTFKLISGKDELPEGRSIDDCTPITLLELFYSAIYHAFDNYYGYLTRYPIASSRSSYPNNVYLMSTIKSEKRFPLDDSWEIDTTKRPAYTYPILGSDTFNSMSPHPCRLKGLGADFDGDKSSFNGLMSDESIIENNRVKGDRSTYVDGGGNPTLNLKTDTINFVMYNITGPYKE